MYAVIFDMDGVLVDSYQAHYETWRRTGEQRGLSLTRELFTKVFGLSFRETLAYLEITLSADEKTAWHQEMTIMYRQIISAHFPAIDGVGDLIEKLAHADFRLAVGSAGPAENVQLVIEKIPQGKYFNAWTSIEEVKKAKPDPEVFLKTAEKLQLLPSQCAVIEDSVFGLTAARAAKMTAIGITTTSPRAVLAQYADLVVERMDELSPKIIKELLKKRE